MFRKLLFSVIFCAPVLCKFDDNALGYCVVDADSPGIFISDGRGKNSSYAGKLLALSTRHRCYHAFQCCLRSM
jgi:hypothetical protein